MRRPSGAIDGNALFSAPLVSSRKPVPSIDDGNLRAAFDAIARLQEDAMESVEERVKDPNPENDLVSSRRPLRSEHVARGIPVDDLRRPGPNGAHHQSGAFRVGAGADECVPIA